MSPPVLQPYLKEEAEALLSACDFSRSWRTRDNTANHRPSADRDRAIILTLLDTGARASEFVFIKFNEKKSTVGVDWEAMTRTGLYKLLARLGQRAKVKEVDCHRFRHTSAINFLRNGGDVFTLKGLLGHTDLEMVERYLELAQSDYAKAHQMVSPVDRWKL